MIDLQLFTPGPIKTVFTGKPDWVPGFIWRIGDAFAPSQINQILNFRLIQLNSYYINLWHFVHGMSGWITRKLGFDQEQAFLIHLLWEAFQYSIEMTPHDSTGWVDIVIDTLFFFGGYMV